VDELDNAQKIDFAMKLPSKGLNRLIRELFNLLPNKQPQRSYRQKLRDCLRIVLINLNSTDGYISYRRADHAREYRLKKYSVKNIRTIVDFLTSKRWIENKLGFFTDDPGNRRISRMRCRKKLRELFIEYNVNQNKIRINCPKNLIVLRDDTKKSISYTDNEFTITARHNLELINEMLSAHSISSGNGLYMHRKILHRVFNRDFNHGGRFYGGVWQSENGNDRLKIMIDKSPVVELDYKALHPTMLYALNELPLKEDPYSLKGYSSEIRGFLKMVMLVLINTRDAEKTRSAIQGMINSKELYKPTEVTNLRKLIDSFIDKHSDIYHSFGNDTGKKLQRLDSDISESIQMHFCKKDIPVLSVHDSFIIASGFEKKIRIAMEEVFYNKFKKICHISKKGRKKIVNHHNPLSIKDLQRF